MTLPQNVANAVDSLRIALNDWTATYASEFCNDDAVEAAHKRISAQGTLGYICDTMASLDIVRAHLLSQEAEITDLISKRDFLLRNYNAAESSLAAAYALLR